MPMHRAFVAVAVPLAAVPAAAQPAPDDELPPGEVIVLAGKPPVAPGAERLDGEEARSAPGALGDPLRALALLPGVATSIAALGYPVIRGALPGESRFSFDGLELPMLYHFMIGHQVLHPGL